MLYLAIKAALSGIIIAIVSEVAKRYPGFGALIASLPLVSVLAMLWLYGETREPDRVAALAMSTFWFILPSLPLFLIIPLMIRSGWSFGVTMALSGRSNDGKEHEH